MTGLIVMGMFIMKGLRSIADRDQYVTVKGLAEREVLADKVVWPLPFKCVSNDMQQLYNEIEKNNNIVVGFLKDGGITEDEIIISAPAVTDRLAQSYVPDNIKFRYQAEAVITVTSSQVEKVIDLMKKQVNLMKQGVIISNEYNYNISFEYTSLNDIKPEMVEEATRNARAVAQKFAEDSGSNLGKIRQATQGQFSISSDETTPQIKNIRVVTTVKYALE
ncbi:MAG: SIMPL domain-containing protein [Bacteroidaceae bacterium]|nr:SIMPL domain-containing protein [Bacteroidaceae bacterium]